VNSGDLANAMTGSKEDEQKGNTQKGEGQ
jgi:hypothetical protein